MTILTHDLADRSERTRRTIRVSAAREMQIKRIARGTATALSMACVLMALIALKTAIQIWLLPS